MEWEAQAGDGVRMELPLTAWHANGEPLTISQLMVAFV
jgi:hypothetical protein